LLYLWHEDYQKIYEQDLNEPLAEVRRRVRLGQTLGDLDHRLNLAQLLIED
jgi:hypothetical protein